eukprot:1330839-Pleurochrysis_carterae.AAC.2
MANIWLNAKQVPLRIELSTAVDVHLLRAYSVCSDALTLPFVLPQGAKLLLYVEGHSVIGWHDCQSELPLRPLPVPLHCGKGRPV